MQSSVTISKGSIFPLAVHEILRDQGRAAIAADGQADPCDDSWNLAMPTTTQALASKMLEIRPLDLGQNSRVVVLEFVFLAIEA